MNTSQEFVAFSMPGLTDHVLMEGQFEKYDKNQSADIQGFILYDFNHKYRYIFPADKLKINAPFEISVAGSAKVSNFEKENYIELASRAIQDIHKTSLDKIVLSRIKQIKGQVDSVWQLFNELKFTYPDAFVYVLFHKTKGLWMGASPELLLQFNQGYYETTAIAGTNAYSLMDFHDMWGEKELAEHEWLEVHLSKILMDEGIEYLKSEKYTHRAGKMAHIRSDYKLSCDWDFLRLAELIHPGPAISGFPCHKAIDWINKHESYDRSFYTGYLGPVNIQGINAVFTNIRCMQLFKNQCALYLGAGITKDSNPHDEFLETEQKSTTLGRFLHKPELA